MSEQSILSYIMNLVFFSGIFLISVLTMKTTKRIIQKNKEKGLYRIKFYNLASKYAIFLTGILIIYAIVSILKLAFFP